MSNRSKRVIKKFQQFARIHNYQIFFFLRLVVTLLLVTLIVSKVDLHVFVITIQSAKISLLFIAISLYFPGQLIASYRWHYLLKKINKDIPFLSIARYQLLGQLSTFLLPGQISGDLVKYFSVSSKKSNKISFAYSIFLDKLFLLFALAIFAMFGLIGSGKISGFLPVYLVAFILLIGSFILITFIGTNRHVSIIKKISVIASTTILHNLLTEPLNEGANIPRLNAQSIFIMFMLAIVLQFLNAIGSYLVLLSLGITIEFIDWAAINAIVAIVLALPITIAGLGIREGILVYILTFYGISASQTVAYSTLALFMIIILLTIGFLLLEVIRNWKVDTVNHKLF